VHFLLSQSWFGPTLITPPSSLDPLAQLTWLLLVAIISCTLMLLTSFVLEMIYVEMEIQHWCMFLGNKICVQILWLRKNHMQGVLLTRIVLCLIWNLLFWEISLELNFDSSSFFLFLFASLHCNTIKKKYMMNSSNDCCDVLFQVFLVLDLGWLIQNHHRKLVGFLLLF